MKLTRRARNWISSFHFGALACSWSSLLHPVCQGTTYFSISVASSFTHRPWILGHRPWTLSPQETAKNPPRITGGPNSALMLAQTVKICWAWSLLRNQGISAQIHCRQTFCSSKAHRQNPVLVGRCSSTHPFPASS